MAEAQAFKKQSNLIHFISKPSYLVSALGQIITIIYLLHPSLAEFLIFVFVVDALALMILGGFLTKAYLKWFSPGDEAFCFGVDPVEFSALSSPQRKALLESMISFPKRLALFMFFSSFVKAIPAYLYIVFGWHYQRSPWLQFFYCLAISAVGYGFFAGCGYYESQSKLRVWLKDLHERFDLRAEFEALTLKLAPRESLGVDLVMQTSLINFTIVVQLISVVDNYSRGPAALVEGVLLVGVVGFVLNTWIWLLSRRQLFSGLLELVDEMSQLKTTRTYPSIALHVSPALAVFGQTFNALVKRIASNEKQLRQSVFREAERSRFEALGEISGLVAHDLSGPLQVTKYCIEELEVDPQAETLQRYLPQMRLNVNQATDLVGSLRARLKNSPVSGTQTSFEEAHHHTLRLLATQYGALRIEKINWGLDPQVAGLELALSRVDLIQILDNLYRNSIANFIEFKISDPSIRIQVESQQANRVEISVADNGTGLTAEQFESLTTERLTVEENEHQSLGLRLTRRLIEQQGGELSLVNPGVAPFPGTRFHLTLPKGLSSIAPKAETTQS